MSWSTSELRVRLAPLNRFKPSSKIFYWPFQGGTSFVDLLCFCSVLCLLCFVRVCLYVLCGHLLGKGWPLGSRLWCLLWVCHFPIGNLGQVWYLIVSIPDLCNLITFHIFKGVEVRFADFISFFLNIPWKWNNLCSLRPNYFIFIGYLKTGAGRGFERIQAIVPPPYNMLLLNTLIMDLDPFHWNFTQILSYFI